MSRIDTGSTEADTDTDTDTDSDTDTDTDSDTDTDTDTDCIFDDGTRMPGTGAATVTLDGTTLPVET